MSVLQQTSTRERILQAALNVFSRKGYHQAVVDDIVAESSTSKGAVYFYFKSKERIFLALVEEFARLLERRVLAAIEAESGGVARVEAALRATLETFGQYRKPARIFLIEAVGLGPAFEEKRLEIHQRFSSIIQEHLDRAVAEGDIPALDTRVASLAWMGAINEVVICWVYTGKPEPAEALPVLRTMLLRSIGAGPGEESRPGEEGQAGGGEGRAGAPRRLPAKGRISPEADD